ncbi:MAG: hypothetical protein NC086_00650 [Alistipes sp.]|nr:hypothetical protein [Alistipes sp.]
MLLLKEMKKVVCSFTFLLFLGVLCGFYFTQFSSDVSRVIMPVEGRDNYGMTETDDPAVIIPAAIAGLESEVANNAYIAYPIGFYKEVTLNDKKQAEMKDILERLKEGYQNGTLSYEAFLEYMAEADKRIGGGSRYSEQFLLHDFGTVPADYEDAKREYEELVFDDRITGAYARLFCDYLGIVLGIMPVFVAASLTERDRKAQMEQLIYSRKISSVKLVLNRFLALIISMSVPVFLLAVLATAKVSGVYEGMSVDFTAIVSLSAVWLLPNILIATAVGMALTECYSPLLAVFAQGIWWIASISSGRLTGAIHKFTLVARHNNLMKRQIFMRQMNDFVFNRCFYAVAALLLTALTVWIYARKRRGVFGGNVQFKKDFSRKSKVSV